MAEGGVYRERNPSKLEEVPKLLEKCKPTTRGRRPSCMRRSARNTDATSVATITLRETALMAALTTHMRVPGGATMTVLRNRATDQGS